MYGYVSRSSAEIQMDVLEQNFRDGKIDEETYDRLMDEIIRSEREGE